MLKDTAIHAGGACSPAFVGLSASFVMWVVKFFEDFVRGSTSLGFSAPLQGCPEARRVFWITALRLWRIMCNLLMVAGNTRVLRDSVGLSASVYVSVMCFSMCVCVRDSMALSFLSPSPRTFRGSKGCWRVLRFTCRRRTEKEFRL